MSPFFNPHPSERNAINITQFSDKSTDGFPIICYTDGSKIDGRVGFAFVVFRCSVESEHFQFRIRDECTVFVSELLCLNFAIKWITEQNSVISEYLICTDSLSSLDSLKCISSSNNIIVEIQKQLKMVNDSDCCVLGTGFKPRKDMNVCNCIVPVRYKCHFKYSSSRKTSHVVDRKEKRWKASKPNRTVTTCMVFKATSNDRRKSLACCHNEFRRPLSGPADRWHW
ncbi:RNase H domain-containing protein [Trichonephila clavipes]|nr:RNase H domain-containing protein [Trichonephila clavipes]